MMLRSITLLLWIYLCAVGEGQYSANCTVEVNAFHTCVKFNGGLLTNGTNLCGTCIYQSFPVGLPWCDLVDEACVGLASCDYCQGCEASYLQYIRCASADACNVSCPILVSTTPPSMAPTPPAVTGPNCTVEVAAFHACVKDKGGYLSNGTNICGTCIYNLYPADATWCEVVDDTCAGLASCAYCKGCEDSYLTAVRCGSGGGCDVSCPSTNPTLPPTAPPTSPKCVEETTAYEKCLDDASLSHEECHSCVDAYWSKPVDGQLTCDDVQGLLESVSVRQFLRLLRDSLCLVLHRSECARRPATGEDAPTPWAFGGEQGCHRKIHGC